eukprot:c20573_g1_i2.p1 GENE.c20573_g1_i2~~c20573_g1_i2.p1  ORF type:complete len:339 (+),score=62.91 c20573_g1_i2:29-1018(+)
MTDYHELMAVIAAQSQRLDELEVSVRRVMACLVHVLDRPAEHKSYRVSVEQFAVPEEWYTCIDFPDMVAEVDSPPGTERLAVSVDLVNKHGHDMNDYLRGPKTFQVHAGRAKLSGLQLGKPIEGDGSFAFLLRLHFAHDDALGTLNSCRTKFFKVYNSHSRFHTRDFRHLRPSSPIAACPYIGRKYADRLMAMGINTIGDLGKLELSESLSLCHKLHSRGRPLKQALVASMIDQARQLLSRESSTSPSSTQNSPIATPITPSPTLSRSTQPLPELSASPWCKTVPELLHHTHCQDQGGSPVPEAEIVFGDLGPENNWNDLLSDFDFDLA